MRTGSIYFDNSIERLQKVSISISCNVAMIGQCIHRRTWTTQIRGARGNEGMSIRDIDVLCHWVESHAFGMTKSCCDSCCQEEKSTSDMHIEDVGLACVLFIKVIVLRDTDFL